MGIANLGAYACPWHSVIYCKDWVDYPAWLVKTSYMKRNSATLQLNSQYSDVLLNGICVHLVTFKIMYCYANVMCRARSRVGGA